MRPSLKRVLLRLTQNMSRVSPVRVSLVIISGTMHSSRCGAVRDGLRRMPVPFLNDSNNGGLFTLNNHRQTLIYHYVIFKSVRDNSSAWMAVFQLHLHNCLPAAG